MTGDLDHSRYTRQQPERGHYSGQIDQSANSSIVANQVAKTKDSSIIKPTLRESMSRRLRKQWWKYAIVCVLLIGLVFLILNYIGTKNKLEELTNAKSGIKTSDQQLVEQLGNYILLPKDETPTIATVNDASRLKNQVFFLNAQDGDKVIIYAKAKTAILYRPSVKKILEYAPINVGSSK